MRREVLKRLGKEYWAAALVAALWTACSSWPSRSDLKLVSVVNVFVASFFLVSWATGQVFRVMKQTQLERNLTGIENRLMSLLGSLEKQTEDLVGYSTGGDSIAYFKPSHPVRTNEICLDLENRSRYPVFDFYSELIDLDEAIDPINGKFWTRRPASIPSLYPNKIIPQVYCLDMSKRDLVRVNVFIHTRTKNLVQQFRIARVGDRFSYAAKTECDGEVLQQQIPDDFPVNRDNLEGVFR